MGNRGNTLTDKYKQKHPEGMVDLNVPSRVYVNYLICKKPYHVYRLFSVWINGYLRALNVSWKFWMPKIDHVKRGLLYCASSITKPYQPSRRIDLYNTPCQTMLCLSDWHHLDYGFSVPRVGLLLTSEWRLLSLQWYQNWEAWMASGVIPWSVLDISVLHYNG